MFLILINREGFVKKLRHGLTQFIITYSGQSNACMDKQDFNIACIGEKTRDGY